jgi:hypothetical protein
MQPRKSITALLGAMLALPLAAWSCGDPRKPIKTTPVPVHDDPPPLSIAQLNAHNLVFEQVPALRDANIRNLDLIDNEALPETFPGYEFFAWRIGVHPVDRGAPKGLGRRNLFIVTKDGQVRHLKSEYGSERDTKKLEKFFRADLGLVKDDESAKRAVEAWLRLTEEFTQDGWLRFLILKDSLNVQKEQGGRKASGKNIVTAGGKGEIRATLYFTEEGQLRKVEETNTVLLGVRPRCQATKLLDPDTIVRQMAEQDILVMGRSCKDYLDEQRAKASLELQQAIDRIWNRIVDEGW